MEFPNPAPFNLTLIIVVHTLGGILKGLRLKIFKFLAAALIAPFALSSLAGCSAEKLDPQAYAAIIDLRELSEWDGGHLEGAVLIPISAADFATQVSVLDPSLDYYIYCRSGNRSGQAISQMRDLGFTGELKNGGSVANASSRLDIAVVKD